jgi:hypothetical protein
MGNGMSNGMGHGRTAWNDRIWWRFSDALNAGVIKPSPAVRSGRPEQRSSRKTPPAGPLI